MNFPKNLKFSEFPKAKDFKLKWEFDLSDKKICIQCFYIFSSKIYKILYNKKVIKEEKYDDNYNIIKFNEEGHFYEINLNLDSYNFTLFIDNKSFDDLYKKEKELNNLNEEVESCETGINIGNEEKINGINFGKEDVISIETGINYENGKETPYETGINNESCKFGNNTPNLNSEKNFNFDRGFNYKMNNKINEKKLCYNDGFNNKKI